MMFWMHAALGAPVMWSGSPTAEDRAAVSRIPGLGAEVSPETIDKPEAIDRADAAFETLNTTLKSVRQYEARLDGERVIMDDLQAALDGIAVVRDGTDRETLFRARAYQGFAVHRFYGAELEGDEAQPWRVELGSSVAPSPWMHAVALEPERSVTPYDIAEAPQRQAFEQARDELARALPAGLRFPSIPEGATVFVDGRPLVDTGPTLRLPPGTHYVHLELDEARVSEQRIDIESGASESITFDFTPRVPVDLTSIDGAFEPQGELLEWVEAVGGELWVAHPGEPSVWSVTKDGVQPVSIPEPPRPEREGGFSVAVGAGAGWMTSADFYLQDPTVPRTAATVNTLAIRGQTVLTLDVGRLRFEGGVDAAFTPGAHHVALSGERAFRVRATPFVGVGVPWVVAAVGMTLPYHPSAGLRTSVPLGPLEIGADGWFGLPTTLTRSGGTTYKTSPLVSVGARVGYRWRAGR